MRGRRRLLVLVSSATAITAGVVGLALGPSGTGRRTATTGSASAGLRPGAGLTAASATGPGATTPGPASPDLTTLPPAATPTTVAAKSGPGTPAAKAAPASAPTHSRSVPVSGGSGSLAGKIVVIDPGHDGGNGSHPADINRLVPAGGFQKACDTAGTATDAGYAESAFTFDVAQRLASDLRGQGATVVMTRNSNDGVGPCVDQRAAVGNQARANAAISIHADGGPPGGRGFHVIQPALVAGYTDNIVAPSHQLALAVRAGYQAGTAMPFATYTASQGLDTRSDLGGLNLSTVPKVFIECGNMRNATDAALLSRADYRQKAADALESGLATFLHSA